MKTIFYAIAVFLVSQLSLFGLEIKDQKKIYQIIEHFENAWNAQAGHGVGNCYAQDADFINIFGVLFKGRQEIEARHIKILETFLKGSVFETSEVKLREIKSNVVLAHVHWKLTLEPEKKDSKTMTGIFSHLFLKNKGKWEITSSQNTQLSKPN